MCNARCLGTTTVVTTCKTAPRLEPGDGPSTPETTDQSPAAPRKQQHGPHAGSAHQSPAGSHPPYVNQPMQVYFSSLQHPSINSKPNHRDLTGGSWSTLRSFSGRGVITHCCCLGQRNPKSCQLVTRHRFTKTVCTILPIHLCCGATSVMPMRALSPALREAAAYWKLALFGRLHSTRTGTYSSSSYLRFASVRNPYCLRAATPHGGDPAARCACYRIPSHLSSGVQ